MLPLKEPHPSEVASGSYAHREVGFADGLYHSVGGTAVCDRTARTPAL
jgi:hypothetical protein